MLVSSHRVDNSWALVSVGSDEGSRDREEAERRPEVTSLAEELRMMERSESCDKGMMGLLPAQDSCEVDSLPELDKGICALNVNF